MRDRDKHSVRSPAVRTSPNLFYQLTTAWVKRLESAEGEALLTALGNGITGIQLGAFQLADHEELKPYGPTAQDQHCLGCCNAGFLDGFDNGVDRLDKGGFFKAYVIWERYDAAFGYPGHGFDVLRETAAVGRKPCRESRRFVLLALGEEALLTVKASATGSMVKAHDSVAGRPLRHATADCNDRACELVTENLRGFHITLEDFLDIRTADATRSDSDEHFAFEHFRDRNFLNVNDAFVTVDTGTHGFRDGPQRIQSLRHGSEAAHVAENSSIFECAGLVQY
jgi:hypothetical protein